MFRPDMFEYYGYSSGVTNLWDFGNEELRIEEPKGLGTNPSIEIMESAPTGDNDDGNDGLEYLGTNSNAGGIESDPADDDNDGDNGRRQEKKSVRYTQYQTQELIAFFEKYPGRDRPSRHQREELGRAIGLTHVQIKFWCQNRRSRLKDQRKIQENTSLKAEIDELRAENAKYKEALGTTCNGRMTFNELLLMAENNRLKDELRRIFAITSKHVKKPSTSTSVHSPAQLSPKEPASTPSKGADWYHPECSNRVNEFTAMTNQSNPGAPSRNPHEVRSSALVIRNPQDKAR